MNDPHDSSDWAASAGRRTSRNGGPDTPFTRPERPTPLDHDAIREWTAANLRARREYYSRPFINGGMTGRRSAA